MSAESKAVLFACAAVFAVISAGAAFFIRIKNKTKAVPFFLAAAFFFSVSAALVSSYLYFNVRYEKAKEYTQTGTEYEIEGIVLKNTYSKSYCRGYDIVILRIGGDKARFKAKLHTEYTPDIEENDRFIIRAWFESPQSYKAETLRYHLAGGFLLHAVSENDAYTITGSNGFSLTYLLSRINVYASQKIKFWVGGDEGKFISALTLGNKEDIPPVVGRDVKRLGLSHVLAVSGMHLSVTLGILQFILTALKTRKHIIYCLLIVFAVIYMGITGFAPSVIRCTVMTVLYYTMLLAGERPNSVGTLLLSAAFICLINPPSVLDIGFILSFTATLGLCTAGTALQRHISAVLGGDGIHLRVLRTLLQNLASSYSAVLFTLPFVWLFFGEISIVSPVMSLLFNPLASVILFLSPFFIAVNFIPPLGAAAAFAMKAVSRLFIYAASYFAQSAGYTVSLNYSFVKYIILLFTAVLILLCLLKIKKIWLIFIPSLAGILAFAVCLSVYNSEHEGISALYYYHDGIQDGIILMEKNRLLVCDISDGSFRITNTGYDIGRENHADEVDTYMLTHYHNRHINTFIKLAEETYVKTLCLPVPVNENESRIYSVLVALAGERNCETVFYTREKNSAVFFGRMSLVVFPYTKLKRSAHPVICIGVTDGDESALYMGGAVYESENAEAVGSFASSTGTIFIGAHSPKLKSVFDCPIADVYFSDKVDLSFIHTNLTPSKVGSEPVEILFHSD